MSIKIAVASGKGGTGKTTVAVNLFRNISADMSATLVDCDIEEPNDIIFFPKATKKSSKKVFQTIPEINKDQCTFCKKCVEYCQFNAISIIPSVNFAEVNSTLCHSCGACLVACKSNAITENLQPIGEINRFQISNNSYIAEGRLKIGSAMQTMLLKNLKGSINNNHDIIIYDAPPGTSCSVVETVSNCDYTVLVSEPTPFGVHDLKLMVELLEEIGLPYGLVINKAGLGNNDIYQFIEEKNITILAEIPFSEGFAANYAAGNLTQNLPIKITESFDKLSHQLLSKTNA